MTDEIKRISSVYGAYNNTKHEHLPVKKASRQQVERDDFVDFSSDALEQSSGLGSARQFHDLFDYELSRSERYDTPFSLIHVRIANFGDLNHVFGHFTTSCLMNEIGRTIRDSIRSVDRSYHYGADSFMILLPNTPFSGAETMVSKLAGKIGSFSFTSVRGDVATADPAFGIASFPVDGTTSESLLSRVTAG